MRRAAGILLPVFSLPSEYGAGSLGAAAERWIDFLAAAGQSVWQVLPLSATGAGDSPYLSPATESGNPIFIDPDRLFSDGLVTRGELRAARLPRGAAIDYARVREKREPLLRAAFAAAKGDPAFVRFARRGGGRDAALFSAIRRNEGDRPFRDWPFGLKYRLPDALDRFAEEHADEVLYGQFLYYRFLSDYDRVHAYARKKNVKIFGDLPLYPSPDSADVWGDPASFDLDEELLPRRVAGVPPDAFSESGQLWGSPVYCWEREEAGGFAFWKRRFAAARRLFDLVRIDHFRGLDRFWAIPADSRDAASGEWVPARGRALFAALGSRLPVVAEDLGVLDGGVLSLLAETGFPGMKVLQFAYDGNPENPYLPENIPENAAVYTGTHDNDTIRGYLSSLSPAAARLVRSGVKKSAAALGVSVGTDGIGALSRAFVTLAYASRARLAVVPAQDILFQGSASRTNVPGTPEGNWRYRLRDFRIEERAADLSALALRFGRRPRGRSSPRKRV